MAGTYHARSEPPQSGQHRIDGVLTDVKTVGRPSGRWVIGRDCQRARCRQMARAGNGVVRAREGDSPRSALVDRRTGCPCGGGV